MLIEPGTVTHAVRVWLGEPVPIDTGIGPNTLMYMLECGLISPDDYRNHFALMVGCADRETFLRAYNHVYRATITADQFDRMMVML